jgi:hypothetical protein
MELYIDNKFKLQYEIEPEQKALITFQDEKLINQLDGNEVDDGIHHHRLTITVAIDT